MVDVHKVAEVLGGRQVLGKQIGSVLELDEAVSKGLPKSALRSTVRRVYDEPAAQRRAMYSVVPEATYKRRRDRLSAAESERTERLARTIAAAEYVWDDRDDARAFLLKPHWELAGKSPMQAASTELGAREVETILFRIFYGIPS